MATLCSDHVKLSDIKWASHFLGQWGFRNWGLQPIEMQDAEVMRWPGDSAHYLCCLNWNIYTNIYVHVDIQYSHLDHINIASRHQHYQHAFTKPRDHIHLWLMSEAAQVILTFCTTSLSFIYTQNFYFGGVYCWDCCWWELCQTTNSTSLYNKYTFSEVFVNE